MTEAVAGIMADLPSTAGTNDQRNVASTSSESNGGADSLVIKVKEVLPDLSDDLIRRCLIEYNNDSERVINAALEGSIPDHLLNPPPSAETSSNKPHRQQEQIKPSDNNIDPNRDLASAAASGLLQLQPGQVWQGKKNHTSNAPMSRKEKKQTKKMAISVWDDDVDEKGSSDEEEGAGSVDRSRVVGKQIPHYSTVDNRDYLYDDEYDDSYDLHVGAVVSENESDSCQPNEPKQRSSTVAPSTLPNKKSVKFKQGPDEVREIAARGAGDEESKPPVRQNVLPIPHPEEVRVQQAHKQLNKAYRRGRVKAGGGSNLPPPQPLPTDTSSTSLPQTSQSGRNDQSAVVDTPASNISSDQSSTRSRAYKEKHKASQANHRRKDRGARKRSVLF